MSSEVAIRDDAPPVGLSLIEGPNPAGAVAYARQVSAAIAGVLEEGSGFVTIQGKKHITIEGWQTMAAMTGHTVEVEWSRPVDFLVPPDGATTLHAWEARAVARDQHGRVVSAGEAMASPDERAPWNRNEFSIRSMAQTRAQSRALASRMRYIVTLAGFAGTPADEMPPADGAPPVTRPKAPTWQERQRDAEKRLAALDADAIPAEFFAGLGVADPHKLSTASVWKKVDDELTKREADAAPVVEGVVISDEEKAERLGLGGDDPPEDPDTPGQTVLAEQRAKAAGRSAPGDA